MTLNPPSNPFRGGGAGTGTFPTMPTILIVDDHEDNRMVLSRLFSFSGFMAIEAPDGASALEQVRTERPDLALVDLLMPVVDGFEFVHRLRREEGPHSRTPVIFITAAYLPRKSCRWPNRAASRRS